MYSDFMTTSWVQQVQGNMEEGSNCLLQLGEDGVEWRRRKHVQRLHDHVDPRWGDQRPPDLQGRQREQVDGREDGQYRLHPKLGRVTQSVWRSRHFKWSHVRTKPCS